MTQLSLRSVPFEDMACCDVPLMVRSSQMTDRFTPEWWHLLNASTAKCEIAPNTVIGNVPFFADIRPRYPDIQNLPECAEDCLLFHGWLPSSPSLVGLPKALTNLPDTANAYTCPPPSTYDPFYGSCMMPADPIRRLATWRIAEWNGEDFWSVSRGVAQDQESQEIRKLWMARQDM